jgi:hypothetical protein
MPTIRQPLLCLALLCQTACGGGIDLNSHWRDREIVIDGADADWGEGRYILENVPISIGVMNDVDHLYLTMVTGDHDLQMLIAMRGLELWLDPKGAKRQVFGLRLPGAIRPNEHGEMPFGDIASTWDGSARRRGPGRGMRTMDPRRLQALFDSMTDSRIRVLDSPEDEGWETSAGVADAIQVKLTYAQGRLVYEARLPLQYLGDPTYTIAATSKTRVGVGLKIPNFMPSELQNMRGARTGAGGSRGSGLGGPSIGGGRRGMGGGMGDRMTGRGNGGAPSGEIFEQWARIHMADGPPQ